MENNIKDFKDGVVFKKTIERESCIVVGEIDDYNLIDNLVKKGREKTALHNLNRKTNVRADHSSFTALSNEKLFIDFLNKIKPSIQKIYLQNFIVADVWINFYKKPNEDFALKHDHRGITAFCGILYCTNGPGPGTYFKDYDLNILEKKGRFVLFDPFLLHEVKPYPYEKERITIAWNFNELKEWEK
jgi:hypothetical protein